MNYKQKKHLRQNLDFNNAISKTEIFFIFQLKPINILNWLLLKKILLQYELKSKFFSIKSFKKDNVFNVKSKLIKNIYKGKMLVVYAKNKNVSYLTLSKIISFFENTSFFIFLHLAFNKNFFSLTSLKNLIKICSKNAKLELIYLLLQSYKLLNLIDNLLYKSLHTLKK